MILGFVCYGWWTLFTSIPRVIALKSEFKVTQNEVGPILIQQFGRKTIYTLKQVDHVTAVIQLTPRRTRFAHAVFCSKNDYISRYGSSAPKGSEFDFSPLYGVFDTHTYQHGASHETESFGGGHDGISHDGGHGSHSSGGGHDGH
jgi:uncharacterized membrane protein YgcG